MRIRTEKKRKIKKNEKKNGKEEKDKEKWELERKRKKTIRRKKMKKRGNTNESTKSRLKAVKKSRIVRRHISAIKEIMRWEEKFSFMEEVDHNKS